MGRLLWTVGHSWRNLGSQLGNIIIKVAREGQTLLLRSHYFRSLWPICVAYPK